MDDPVATKVLEMIATNQRDQHAANTKILERISEDVSEMRTDLAIMLRRLDDLEEWKEKVVDPFLASARDLSSQAKGAGRMVKFIYAIGGVLSAAGLYKFGAALIAALPR